MSWYYFCVENCWRWFVLVFVWLWVLLSNPRSPWYNRTSWLGIKHQLTYYQIQGNVLGGKLVHAFVFQKGNQKDACSNPEDDVRQKNWHFRFLFSFSFFLFSFFFLDLHWECKSMQCSLACSGTLRGEDLSRWRGPPRGLEAHVWDILKWARPRDWKWGWGMQNKARVYVLSSSTFPPLLRRAFDLGYLGDCT